MKHTLNYLNKLKEQGAKRVKIENVIILLESDKKRSEQLKCSCNKPEFTRDCDDYFNIICGKCGKTL